LASLGAAPISNSSGNPVNGNTSVVITSAEGRNLGFNTPGIILPNSNIGLATCCTGTYDSEIGLNTSITSPPNGLSGNYGLQAVANHEIDEALGIGGTGSTLGGSSLDGPVGDLDLYRYSAPGVRSYSNVQTTSPLSYFSINGGATVLSYFNQTQGADYGDWLSNPIPSGYSPQVQDAFGEPGTNPALGPNEITAFNAIGYDVIAHTAPVPEPTSMVLFGSVVLLAGIVGRRRLKAAR
jgi:PEP-CTERM motif